MAKAARGGRKDVAMNGDRALKNGTLNGPPSGLTCPECGGALWEQENGKLMQYRCHVGHAYSPDGLVAAQTQDLEAALWSALRALEESAELRRMARRARQGSLGEIANAYERQAGEAEKQADALRAVLTDQRGSGGFAPPVDDAEEAAGPATKRSRRAGKRRGATVKNKTRGPGGTTSKNRGKGGAA